MATRTSPEKSSTDHNGIERVNLEKPTMIDTYRHKWEWFDHIMRMQERFTKKGGNHHSAGITYFSVLSIFPILMLVFAVAGFILANDPAALAKIQATITDSFKGELGTTINDIVEQAIAQRRTVLGIGGLTALWSGLNWMDNLRFSLTRMWGVDPTNVGFFRKIVVDFIALLVLIIALILAFGVTAIGATDIVTWFSSDLHLGNVPGLGLLAWLLSLVLGLIVNFVVLFWLIVFMPRNKVPKKSGMLAAALGAIIFEMVKQVGSLITASALKNPAGAAFGPIIAVMLVMYLAWRILLYCSAWAATTKESLHIADVEAPQPAIIRIRKEVAPLAEPADAVEKVGAGFLLGTVVTATIFFFRRK